MKPPIFFFIVLTAMAIPSHAADINAPSCSQAAVQAAIDTASNGDRVFVPSGNCTWTGTVTIGGKRLTLQGAGIDSTTITDNTTEPYALNLICSNTAFIRVTGFTFVKRVVHANGVVQVDGNFAHICFRFDHNRILQTSAGGRGITTNNVFGLIDHNTFDMTAPRGSNQAVSPTGTPTRLDGGFLPWKLPLSLGTREAVYIEDNTFNYANQNEDAIDAYGGARLVIRYNTFKNCSVGFHGLDSGGRRSVHSYEIYRNAFINNSPNRLRAAHLRGGTGVLYANTYEGSRDWYGVALRSYRSCPRGPSDTSTWGPCDGTRWLLKSTDNTTNNGRTACTSGNPCVAKWCSNARDTICTKDSDCEGGGTCSTYLDGTGMKGYPCRDQIGRTSHQISAPLYVWDQTQIAYVQDGPADKCTPRDAIQEGRDYFNNGNNPKPGYTAYPYPHPLQGGASVTVPPKAP